MPPSETPDELEPLPPLNPRPDNLGPEESWEEPGQPATRNRARLRWLWLPAALISLTWLITATWMKTPEEEAGDDIGLTDLDTGTHTSAPLPTRHETERLIKAYLGADSLEALLTTVYQPERIRLLAKSHTLVPREFDHLELLARQTRGTHTYHLAKAVTKQGDTESFILRHRLSEGWRIDWETQVTYNPQSWETMISSKPKETLTLRVRAAAGDYYNFQFSDKRAYLCVELREPHGDATLYGYIDRETTNSRALMQLLDKGKEAPIMVSIRFPQTGESQAQAHLVEFLQPGWLVLGAPPSKGETARSE